MADKLAVMANGPVDYERLDCRLPRSNRGRTAHAPTIGRVDTNGGTSPLTWPMGQSSS